MSAASDVIAAWDALQRILDADNDVVSPSAVICERSGYSEALVATKQAIEALRREVEAAEDYRQRNPLGGPAKMFDAIADRIRAGDDYYAVLADFGVALVEKDSVRVPREPTPAMIRAASIANYPPYKQPVWVALADGECTGEVIPVIYRAMLDAARGER